MDSVNVHAAKTNLSRLLDRVERGEEILIARNGLPVARLAPIKPATRAPGRLKGRIRLLQDFDDPLPRSASWSSGPKDS
jgi:prevent-host-death family protein